MNIAGSALGNIKVRLTVYIFMGVLAVGSLMYWSNNLVKNAEYVDLGAPKHKNIAPGALRSGNYQIEPLDASPTVK